MFILMVMWIVIGILIIGLGIALLFNLQYVLFAFAIRFTFEGGNYIIGSLFKTGPGKAWGLFNGVIEVIFGVFALFIAVNHVNGTQSVEFASNESLVAAYFLGMGIWTVLKGIMASRVEQEDRVAKGIQFGGGIVSALIGVAMFIWPQIFGLLLTIAGIITGIVIVIIGGVILIGVIADR